MNVRNGVRKCSLYLIFDDNLVVVVGKVVTLRQSRKQKITCQRLLFKILR